MQKRRHPINEKAAIAKKSGDINQLFNVYAAFGSMYNYLFVPDSALYFFHKADSLIKQVDRMDYKAHYLLSLGMYYSKTSDLEKALDCYMQALDVTHKLPQSERSLAKLYNNIASIFFKLGDHKSSTESYYKAFKYSKLTHQAKLMAMSLYNISSNHITNNDSVATSKKLLKEALQYAQQTKNDFVIARIYMNTAVLNEAEKDYDAAIANNTLALNIFFRLNALQSISLTLQNLALNYLAIQNYAQAQLISDSALQFVQTHHLTSERPYVYHLMFQVDSTMGNLETALAHYQESVRINDSLNHIKHSDKINALQVQYETLEKEKAIESLNHENHEKALEITQQRLENYILWGIIGLSVLAMAMGVYQYSLHQKRNTTLNLKNQEIAEKHQKLIQKSLALKHTIQDKEVLLRELHHRVKNNLQLVSSILNLQAERYQSPEINEFVSRSQDRILSMALTHQILYMGNSLEKIDFRQYLNSLLEAVWSSFDFTGKTIRYEVKAQALYFPIDTAIPLGIIINELVHNAMKYAFVYQQEGLLKIIAKKTPSGSTTIIIQDDGPGMAINDTATNRSYGLKLVKLLIRQIKGEILTENTPGVKATIVFG